MWQGIVDNITILWGQLRWLDFLDLLLVWAVVYKVLLLSQRSGAVQILSGMGVLSLAYLVSSWLELITFNWLLEKFFSNLFLIVVILFQGEIRRALAQIGSNPFFTGVSEIEDSHGIEELAKGAVALAQKGYGALIVIEREIALDYFVEIGTELNCSIRSEILKSIFLPNSPLHDGAVIIRGAQIFAAGCFLPLSKNPALDRHLGTRHRAAIGLTEETDAIVFVVSEEKHNVSIVQGGQLTPDVDHPTIRQVLYDIYGRKPRTDRGSA